MRPKALGVSIQYIMETARPVQDQIGQIRIKTAATTGTYIDTNTYTNFRSYR
jgi:hypothetical protein